MEFGIRRQEFHSVPDKNKSNKELVENAKGRFSLLAYIIACPYNLIQIFSS